MFQPDQQTKAYAGSTGLSFPSILTVAFIVLKLTGHIGWSWWWVLAPLWIGWAVVLAIVLIMLIVVAIAER